VTRIVDDYEIKSKMKVRRKKVKLGNKDERITIDEYVKNALDKGYLE
jgi:hypothetical protein